MLWLVGVASAAEIHAKLETGDGLVEQASWPSVETFNSRWGPVGDKVSAVWTLTVQPSVWDPLEAAYRVEITTCVEWSKGRKSDKHCEKGELLSRPEPTSRTWKVKGTGATHEWTLSTWITGETPASGLPASEPAPSE